MPITVRVQNCQSIQDATIILDGLTVITGPNNSGKTAYMRAIRALFTNAPVGPLVRHGAQDLIVTIDFQDGRKVRFTKGKTKPTYRFWGPGFPDDGKDLNPGAKVPDELAAFGIFPLEVGRDKLWPQVATQFASGQFSGPLFLLDRPGSIMAEVVSDVERVGRLSRAMKSCDSDARSIRDKLKTRRGDLEDAEKALHQFKDLSLVEKMLVAIERKTSESVLQAHHIDDLEGLQRQLSNQQDLVERLSGISSVHLTAEEIVGKARNIGQTLPLLNRLCDERTILLSRMESLQGIEDVSIPESSKGDQARTLFQDVLELRRLHQSWSSINKQVSDLDGIDQVEIPSQGEGAQTALRELVELILLQKKYQLARDEMQVTQEVDSVPDVDVDAKVAKAKKIASGVAKLENLQAEWVKARSQEQDLDDELGEINCQIPEHENEIHKLMDELGVTACSECGSLRGAA